MRHITYSLIASLLALGSCSEASAFGRGGPGGGGGHAAPPHASGGGARVAPGRAPANVGHGIASGPHGGVHAYTPPRAGGVAHVGDFPHGTVIAPGGGGRGVVAGPTGGVRPGVVGAPGIGERGTAFGAGGYRGGVEVGRGGVAGGFNREGHATAYLRPSALRDIGRGIRDVRYPYFTRDWYRNRDGVWFPPAWFGGVGPWYAPPWDTVAPFVGIDGPPIDYDYGSTAVFQDNSLYLNGDPVGSAEDYAAQALALSNAGRAAAAADTDEWEPLGVFGLIQAKDTVAQRFFQLAVNKAGAVHGNYYDAIADSTQPVFGEVDKKTQRVAWSIGDRKDIVFEAGLNNLTQTETTVLIHNGKTATQQMILVRIPAPPDSTPPAPLPTPPQR